MGLWKLMEIGHRTYAQKFEPPHHPIVTALWSFSLAPPGRQMSLFAYRHRAENQASVRHQQDGYSTDPFRNARVDILSLPRNVFVVQRSSCLVQLLFDSSYNPLSDGVNERVLS